MNPIQQDIPTRERSHFDIQKDSRKVFGNSFTSDDALCPGCGTSAIREEGGLVVAFGQSFFHVDCFRCAKCHEKVTADTNLLLLSDGSPVCANCTYCCTICQQAINDEAIMAGEDSFHAHCFKCKICKNRIDELTYARTSHGIYCMDCHNDRVARNRRHAQKKAEMAASGGSKPRSVETRKLVQEMGQSHAAGQTRLASSRLHRPVTPSSDVDSHLRDFHMDTSAKSELSRHDNDTLLRYDNSLTNDTAERGSGLTTSNLSLNAASRSISSGPEQLGSRSQPITSPAGPVRDGRRRSLDDRVRPLDVRVKRSEDRLVGTNSGRPLSPIDVRNVSPIPLSPAISNHTSTRKFSVSSSRLHLEETYIADLPKSQTDHVPYGSFGSKHQESFDGSACSPPSHHSSARQSYEMHDNPIMLDPERHKKEATFPSGLHPQSVAVHSSVTYGRRSPSPVSRVFEPHGTENELSVEIESNVDSTSQQAPPLPKDHKAHDVTNNESSDFEPDTSTASHDSVVNEPESIPVTQLPHTAYIAPALPPIRFSMNSTDFADLLTSVSVLRSREPPIQPEHIDGGISQAKDTFSRQPSHHTTTQSYERVAAESTAYELKSKPFFERSDDVHKDSGATFQRTYITEPLIDVPVNFSPPSNQQNVAYPTSVTLDDAAVEPVIGSGDEQGVLYAGDGMETIMFHLKDLLRDEDESRNFLDRKLTDAILRACKVQQDGFVELKEQHESIKRTNTQYIESLTVAQAEYERELKARRDAEAEVTRLKVLLSAQTAKLTAFSGDSQRQEQRQKSIKDAHDTLAGLENELSRLIVQRDIILAEVQDLANIKSASPASFIRTLTQSMDNLRNQYQRDLIPLKQERQILGREVMELDAMRYLLLEETAALNAQNEELAILNQEYLRRIDALHLTNAKDLAHLRKLQEKSRVLPQQTVNMALPSINVPSFPNEEEKVKGSQRADGDMATPSKKFKWPGYKGRDNTSHTHNNDLAKSKPHLEHNFTQMSILRFTRCDRCGDKMWGSQLRCTFCNMSIHVRCAVNVHVPCARSMIAMKNDHVVPVSSMFGRDLTEQATADSTRADYFVPFIVEKCIEAVETLALDYEGIYRKNGGAGQSRLITQLFERGDYAAFDLRDPESFPDICSVTSVLKNYFRSLPVPLLTFDLYEDIISAMQIPDPVCQDQTLRQLVNKLPPAHYHTLQRLMIHLHCIHEHSDRNRMNARNLGVVFGPTLMKSRDPGAEFGDMAEKARSIEWLIGNAPSIFDSESQQ